MLLIFFLCFSILKISSGQDETLVDKYVKNITEFEEGVKAWQNPTNSNSYLGKNFNSRVHINDGEYDFIICGAGSAGTVIANRLSEITNWKILLLEAGTWENNITDIPGLATDLRASHYNWAYKSVSQTHGMQGYIDNSIYTPRGKAIGGSSVINSLVYARGNKEDYNKWGENNPGWSYEDMLPYFKKSEKVSFPDADPKYHGTNGTLHVEFSRTFDQYGQAYLDANKELGRKILDYNGANQIGFSIIQYNEIEGRRDSGGKAFIDPAKERSNLRIITDTLITKLIINQEKKEVFGVTYIYNGKLHYATARKEVILSAGAINTPQILMLSGIGPEEHLKDLNISVVQNLPVGDNMWDHLFYTYQVYKINETIADLSLRTQVEEFLNGSGPLTASFNTQVIGFINTTDPSSEVPDIEYLFNAFRVKILPYDYYRKIFGITNETYEEIVKPVDDLSQLYIYPVLLHPKSRGTIRLKSASPLDFPLINPNYFSAPEDSETLATAMQSTIEGMNTIAMKKFNPEMVKLCHSNCNCSDFGSHNFWKCMVTTLSTTVFHYSGTAKMGPIDDKTSVVDNNLFVHGIKGLRVADCSIIPVTISGHTNAIAFAIGEKASDLIKNYYNVA